MKLICVAVRDRQLDAFMRPFFMQATGQAIRAFSDEINRNAPDNPLAQHPEDYDLYQLATFDEDLGEFMNSKKQLAVGTNLKLPKEA